MKVYNQEKTQILTEYNLDIGRLKPDTIEINHPEVQAVEVQFHYETIKEYYNDDGSVKGSDVKKIIDVEGVEYQPARTEVIDIHVYIPYTPDELREINLNKLRDMRETECFSVINRGQLWYNKLTDWQREELGNWYQQWLDITDNYLDGIDINTIIPTKPSWLK